MPVNEMGGRMWRRENRLHPEHTPWRRGEDRVTADILQFSKKLLKSCSVDLSMKRT